MSRNAVYLLLLGCLLIAGCTTGTMMTPLPTQVLVPSTATPEPLTSTPTEAIEVDVAPPQDVIRTSESVVVPAAAQMMVGRVIEDLAKQLTVSSADIELRAVQEVVWPDATLGCTTSTGQDMQPSVTGTALAEVDGYRITLAYQGDTFHYHTDDQVSFVFCTTGGVVPDGEPVIIDTLLGSMVDVARRDLASQLDLPLRRVFVVEAYRIVWPDDSMGCQRADQEVKQTPVPGYRIVLRAGPEEYAYHGNYRQVRICPADAVTLPEGLISQQDVTPTLDSGE